MPYTPCSRLHGHNYEVTVSLGSPELDERGFVLDVTELRFFKQYIDSCLDHRHLNEALPQFEGLVTAESLARHMFEWLVENSPPVRGRPITSLLRAVRVRETPTIIAEYSRT